MFSNTELARTPDPAQTPNTFASLDDAFKLDALPSFNAEHQITDQERNDEDIESKLARDSALDDKALSRVSLYLADSTPDQSMGVDAETKQEIDDQYAVPSSSPSPTDPEERSLMKAGYFREKKLADTLQGAVYEVERIGDGKKFVAKMTDRSLHRMGMTIQSGRQFAIKEDIENECRIMRALTKLDGPCFMVKFVDFLETKGNYYLVQQHGGTGLFEFVVTAHRHIQDKRLSIREWRKFVKYLMWQMSVYLLWLHNVGRCCHLDVSLENILVRNGTFIEAPDGSLSVSSEIEIRFCDFGLAEMYAVDSNGDTDYLSTKYCGKTNYKSPQVYAKKGPFDGRKADVYSLGVSFFCLAVGAPPYKVPSLSDTNYRDFVSKGKIANLLYQWRRHHYVTERMVSLIMRLMDGDEDARPTMDEVVRDPWLRSYHQRYHHMIREYTRSKR